MSLLMNVHNISYRLQPAATLYLQKYKTHTNDRSAGTGQCQFYSIHHQSGHVLYGPQTSCSRYPYINISTDELTLKPAKYSMIVYLLHLLCNYISLRDYHKAQW